MTANLEQAQVVNAAMERKAKSFDKTISEMKSKVDRLSYDLDVSQKETRMVSAELFKVKSSNDNIVRIFNGQVQGEIRTNELTDTDYRAFHAIPYANPPIGDLRFKPPEPFVDKWNEKYDASNSSRTPMCPRWPTPRLIWGRGRLQPG